MYQVKKLEVETIIEVAQVKVGTVCLRIHPGFVIVDESGSVVIGKHSITGKLYAECFRTKKAAKQQCDFLNTHKEK